MNEYLMQTESAGGSEAPQTPQPVSQTRPAASPIPQANQPSFTRWTTRPGKVRPMILLWALGVPIPLLLIFFLFRGCA